MNAFMRTPASRSDEKNGGSVPDHLFVHECSISIISLKADLTCSATSIPGAFRCLSDSFSIGDAAYDFSRTRL
jgi:hypothetical protein